jgi:hypothetical protein
MFAKRLQVVDEDGVVVDGDGDDDIVEDDNTGGVGVESTGNDSGSVSFLLSPSAAAC